MHVATKTQHATHNGYVVSTGRWLEQSVIARTRRRLDSLTERATSWGQLAKFILLLLRCCGRRPTANSVNIKQISAANSLTWECLDNYPAIIYRRCTWQRRRASLGGCDDCLTNDRRVYAVRSPKSCWRTSRVTPHITLSPLLGLKLYQASNSKRSSLEDVPATYLGT